MLRTVLVIAILGLISHSALAARVAVVPSVYTDVNAGSTVDSAASKVDKNVVKGIEEAGFEAVVGDEVEAVFNAESQGGECDSICLNRVKDALGVDEVIFVKVDDEDQINFSTTISFALRNEVSDTRTAGFFVVLEWLKGAVALALKQDVPTPEVAGPIEADTDAAVEEDTETDTAPDNTVVEVSTRKKLGPAPFFIAAGATLAFGVTAIVLDSVAGSKFDSLEENNSALADNDFNSDADTVENLQLTTKIFLGATAAALVTTGVLAIFTDFKKNRKEQNVSRVLPGVVIGENAGAFVLGGRF